MADESSRGANIRQYFLVGGLVLFGAVIAFSIWYAFLHTNYVEAFTGLRSNDAMTIVSELDRLKTPYELADDGATILVPEDQVDSARVSILGGDLPLKGAVGFELFNKSDMGLTEFAQKINYQRALQGELARTIMALEEVETARVHLSLPESGIFEQDRRVAKASVTIATKVGGDVSPTAVRGIQQLVSSAVPDLQAANVAILDARGQLLSDAPPTLPQESPKANVIEAGDQLFAAKIRQALQDAGFAMPVVVNVISQPAAYLPAARTPEEEIAQEDPTRPSSSVVQQSPLKVLLILGAEPGIQIRERMVEVTKQAVDFDQTRGDTITLSIDPLLGQPRPNQLPVSVPRSTEVVSAQRHLSMPNVPLWPFGLALAILAGLVVFSRLRRPSKLLTLSEREAFSARLRSLLDEGISNGKSPA